MRLRWPRCGSKAWLKPDLRLTLVVGPHQLHWFVEVDRGSEHRPALVRKISTYLAAWHDGGEQARAGVFPRVLWVVPDERRGDVIRHVCRTTNGVPDGMFDVALSNAAVKVLTHNGGAA